MKNLKGMKKDFSSLENKKLTDLSSTNGGRAMGGYTSIQSNVFVGEGCIEYDHYEGPNGTGGYIYREIRRLAPGEPVHNY
ncbi:MULTISPECIES: TIGR04139 family peptide modification target [Pedobacter]|uniref:Putative peptide modification target, TIGR04139 family n=1 Tax=Pedobacter suwonensis TaxID=332999 RepID=A0A1I0T6B3_9SPHI|nr:TIGR04139 family peptide modification target [Pedobacter suwonensis]SFA47328.1 putative peptide modification target, TIGR04139 family [Pedobacter suwonensis]